MWAMNLYFLIAAIGFPILGSHWIVYEHKMSKQDYRTGYDDGWDACDNQHDKKYPNCDWASGVIE